MADVVDYPRVAPSLAVPHYALRVHVSTTACLLLLLLYCSPTSAFRPISRQIVSKLPAARRGSSARMVPPGVAQLLAARRAERASAGGRRGGYSRSGSSGLRASSAAAPQASAADTAALKAIFTAALLPIPAKQPNACTWPGAPSLNFLLRYLPFPAPPRRHPRLLLGDQALIFLTYYYFFLFSCLSPPCSSSLAPSSPPGTIPAFCKGEDQMFYLNLASNDLSGPPTPLSSPACAASLEFLNLASNRLSGPIPATISSFTNLTRLRLDNNALTGAIPAAMVFAEERNRGEIDGEIDGVREEGDDAETEENESRVGFGAAFGASAGGGAGAVGGAGAAGAAVGAVGGGAGACAGAVGVAIGAVGGEARGSAAAMPTGAHVVAEAAAAAEAAIF
ncbi:unnamed protein product [Closterium sp. Naga37s-1]|nr:unnamed protein product [Closterium sp. Naga37s-1]